MKKLLFVTTAALWSVGCSCSDDKNGTIGDPDATTTDAASETSVEDADMVRDGAVDAPGPDDASSDAAADAGRCDFGTATSAATATKESLFGERVPFANNASLPAGMYEVTYVDGCFKFQSTQDWTIHARDDGSTSWHLVGANAQPMTPPVLLPGTVGWMMSNGGYTNFEDCVNANLELEPLVYQHEGGPLGIWLSDTNYPDNTVGENDRNPQWSLELVGCSDAPG